MGTAYQIFMALHSEWLTKYHSATSPAAITASWKVMRVFNELAHEAAIKPRYNAESIAPDPHYPYGKCSGCGCPLSHDDDRYMDDIGNVYCNNICAESNGMYF